MMTFDMIDAGEQVDNQLVDQINYSFLWDQFDKHTSISTWSQLNTQLRDELSDQLADQLSDHLSDHLDDQLWGAKYD